MILQRRQAGWNITAIKSFEKSTSASGGAVGQVANLPEAPQNSASTPRGEALRTPRVEPAGFAMPHPAAWRLGFGLKLRALPAGRQPALRDCGTFGGPAASQGGRG